MNQKATPAAGTTNAAFISLCTQRKHLWTLSDGVKLGVLCGGMLSVLQRPKQAMLPILHVVMSSYNCDLMPCCIRLTLSIHLRYFEKTMMVAFNIATSNKSLRLALRNVSTQRKGLNGRHDASCLHCCCSRLPLRCQRKILECHSEATQGPLIKVRPTDQQLTSELLSARQDAKLYVLIMSDSQDVNVGASITCTEVD